MFLVDRGKCTGCGLCLEACSQQAVRMRNGTAFIDQGLCAGCGACRAACGNDAIYEVEILAPSTAAAARQQSKPLAQPGSVTFWGSGKRATLPRVLAALAPVIIEGLHGLISRRAVVGGTQGVRRGQDGRGRGRRCRRKWLR